MKNNHLCENSLMFELQRDTPLATRTSEKAIGPIRKTTILHMQHNFCLAVLHKHGENSLSETKKNVSFSLWTCVQSPRIQLPENLPTVDILTNSPLDILPKKCVLKLSGHYRAIKSLTLPRSRLCCTLRGLLIQMQNINLRSSDIRRKQNWLLLFAFSSPLFCRFSCLIFFFSLWAFILVGFTLVRKVFGKGLDERKGSWVVEQEFHGNFQVSVTCVFALFSGVLD